jgi:putative hemolysin
MHALWTIFVGCTLAVFAPWYSQAQALPNPAAVYCAEVAATSVHLDGPQTDAYFCAVDDALIEQWTLFRAAKLQQPSLATQRFLNHEPCNRFFKAQDIGQSFCEGCGGQPVQAHSPAGKMVPVCRFKDGSAIGSYTLWLGAYTHHRLAGLLKPAL